LRAAQSAVEDVNFAALRNAIDAIVAGSRRSGNVQVATGMKHQMISGDGWFQGGKNENFALRADFENGAAAITDKQIPDTIERDAGGHAHAFNPLLRAAVGRDAMNSAVVAAGDEEVTVGSEGQAGRIDQRSDVGLHAVIRANLVKRNGNALAPRAAERDVNVAAGIDHWIRDRMKIVGDLKCHANGKGWLSFSDCTT
jgi:hypothetical protein